MNTKRLLDGMPYTRSRDMGPDYLARKFARIRKELEAQRKAKPENVTPISAPVKYRKSK